MCLRSPRSCAESLGRRGVIQDSQYDFTKGKSCLTSQVAFFDGVDKGRAVYVTIWSLTESSTKSFSLNWRVVDLMGGLFGR